jgi:hypothetical protein
MIDQLSPLTRRIVAVGLLVLIVLLAVQLIIAPLFSAIGDQRAELADLRARRVRLEATKARLLPDGSTMAMALAIAAPDRAAAQLRLRALLTGSAGIAGVTLVATASSATADRPRDVAIDLSASGTEAALTTFASLVEHGTPLIRFRHWQIGRDETALPPPGALPGALPGGSAPSVPALRLTGLAIAVWAPLS